MEALTILGFSVGGLCLPLLCAAIAMRKNRSASRWFCLGCVGLFFVPLIGALIALLVLACLPRGTETEKTQKLFGMAVSNKQLFIAAGVFAILFVIGIVGMVPAITTIVQAIR